MVIEIDFFLNFEFQFLCFRDTLLKTVERLHGLPKQRQFWGFGDTSIRICIFYKTPRCMYPLLSQNPICNLNAKVYSIKATTQNHNFFSAMPMKKQPYSIPIFSKGLQSYRIGNVRDLRSLSITLTYQCGIETKCDYFPVPFSGLFSSERGKITSHIDTGGRGEIQSGPDRQQKY